METVSQQAQAIYQAIKQVGQMHEGNIMKVIFPKPVYPLDRNPEKQREFWQYEVSQYGGKFSMPVGDTFETFQCDFDNALDRKVWPFVKELLDAGLIESYNNGFNSYTYYPK